MIEVKEITLEKLKNKDFQDQFPELYELQNLVENNNWHQKHSVLDHIIKVVDNAQKIMDKASEKVTKLLNENVEKHTRRELLFLAACFHDIAKKETFQDGEKTSCPGHEEKGAIKAKPILDKIQLGETEKQLILEMIKHHGNLHKIINPQNNQRDAQYQELKKASPHLSLLLLILAYADTLGSILRTTLPEEFHQRVEFYEKALHEY